MSINGNCKDYSELLDAYLDDELSADEQSRVELHVQSCRDCKNTLEETAALLQNLKSMPKKKSARQLDFGFLDNSVSPACNLESSSIDAYFDNELSDSERLAVQKHLDTCPDCTARLADINSLVFELKALPKLSLKADLIEKLDFTRQAETVSTEAANYKKGSQRHRTVWFGIGGAAAAAVAMFFMVQKGPQETPLVENFSVGKEIVKASKPANSERAEQSVGTDLPVGETAKDKVPAALLAEDNQKEKRIESAAVITSEKKNKNTIAESEVGTELALMPDSDDTAAEALGIGTDEDGLYDIKI